MEVRWIISRLTSALHSASAVLHGPRHVNEQVAALLSEAAGAPAEELEAMQLDSAAAFAHLVPGSIRFEDPSRLAEVTLSKLCGPGGARESFAGLARRLVALQSAFDAAFPDTLETLESQSAEVRERWDARGEGLLAIASRLTDPGLFVEAAEVLLVPDVSGGGGAAHPLYNSVRIEVVAVDPVEELPEEVRLTWLLAQLNFDLPQFQADLMRDRCFEVGRLAMLPAILSAAQEAEMFRLNEQTLQQALTAWGDGCASESGAREADLLWQWWETYQSTNPSWPVALAALDRMLTGIAD